MEIVPAAVDPAKHLKHLGTKEKDMEGVQFSKVIDNNLNPIWNQEFHFPHPPPGLHKLVIALWDRDEPITGKHTKISSVFGKHERDAFLGWCTTLCFESILPRSHLVGPSGGGGVCGTRAVSTLRVVYF